MKKTRPGVVSVVVIDYDGAHDTIACLEGLAALDWPRERLEVVVVETGTAEAAAAIDAAHPWANVVVAGANLGFAGGCNRGVAESSGEYVALLNNDARPHAQWLSTAVSALDGDPSIGCVASKVLDWDGQLIDFVAAAAAFYGHGFKLHVGEADSLLYDNDADVLFASGAAAVMRTDVFRSVGGFDDRYFMFFEDVDLGWRLWLLGYRVRYLAASIVYHRHHSTVGRFGSWREHYLLERNALFTIFKNYDDENLRTVLPAALALAVRRGVVLGGADSSALDLERVPPVPDEPSDQQVSKQLLAPVYAVDAFVDALPSLRRARDELQAHRKRTDQEIVRLFRLPLHPNIGEPRFVEGFNGTVAALDVDDVFTSRRKIVIATGDVLRPQMAGPAIRAWQLALALSREHDVRLVTTQTQECELSHPDFAVERAAPDDIIRLEEWCDVFIFQGFLMYQHPILRVSNKVIVADVYDPFHLEQLEQARDLGEQRRREVVRSSTDVLNEQLARGDFFMCASDKQRDFWLGQLAAVGRVNPLNYDESESLESLITVVPFGVGDTPPLKTAPAIKGVVPGIGPDDKVILWGGGIYNWFDPLTLLRAVDKLRRRLPDVRLYFLGMRHPNPDVPEMRMAVETLELADGLGLTGTAAFFNEGWVAYDDRQNYLLEADIGVSTHLDHVETAFSFRTRILDYFWASLPVVATGGDALAALIDAEGAGITVPPGDVDALEDALFRLLDDATLSASCRAASGRLGAKMRWSEAVQPLVEFCRAPRRAPDLLDPSVAEAILAPTAASAHRRMGWRQDLRIVQALMSEGGPSLVVKKALGRVQRRRAPRP
ncbi:MAG TPA: glycosyltransferase [Acidimicrobiales bacterium]|nr:glycosyltransferase [Acidimicrobiales bacterium]